MEKKLKNEIIQYINYVYKTFPSLKNKTLLINRMIEYIFDFYEDEQIEDIEYENYLDKDTSISLAYLILESINKKYALEFMEQIKEKNIVFSDIYDWSYTTIKEGKIFTRIFPSYDIEAVLALLHEFFHYLHLKKYKNNLHNEDFYLYSEGISMGIEIYTILYLINNNMYVTDCKNYLKLDFVGALYSETENCYVMNKIVDIYNKFHSLSDDCIKRYLIENETPIEVIESINNFSWKDYLDSSRYLFALPMSYLIGKNMFYDEKWKNKFIEMFNNIDKYDMNRWLYHLELNKYFEDGLYLEKLLEKIHTDYHKVVGSTNKKEKKFGEL